MKTLFIVGQALGHVGRALMVAKALQELHSGEIVFAGNNPGKYLEKYVSPNGFKTIPLGSTLQLPSLDYAARLEGALSEIKPDVIVFDISPVPWLLYAKLPPVPQAYITNYFVTGLGHLTTFQDQKFAERKQVINEGRKQSGLCTLNNIRELYEKDLVILADPREVLPDAGAMPAHYTIAGAIWWEPESTLPQELEQLDNILYISLGSTGSNVPSQIIEDISTHLAIKHIVMVSTKPTIFPAPASVPIKFYTSLPGSKMLARATFAITQGGAGSCYQALSAGVPMGFWPTHMNHYILGKRLEELGTGIILDPRSIEQKMAYITNNRDMFAKHLEKFSYLISTESAYVAANNISELFWMK